MFKPCLTLLLGLACLVSAIRVGCVQGAGSAMSEISSEDAAAIQGACEFHVINSKDVCTGNDYSNWCSGPGGFCSRSSCGYTCSKEAGQNFNRTWPATNVCQNATSTNKDCPTSASSYTCFLGWVSICYCANPIIANTCPAQTYVSWTTCQ